MTPRTLSHVFGMLVAMNLVFAPGNSTAGVDPVDLLDFGTTMAAQLQAVDAHHVAVAELVSLDGQRSQLGRLLSEELSTAILRSGVSGVVERAQLERILGEQRFQLSDLSDPSTAASVGRLVGVDAVIVGTYADLGTTIRVNIRMVNVESGAVVSAAALTLNKDDSLRRLAVADTAVLSMSSAPSTSTSDSAGRANAVFFVEDFSSVPSGAVPPGWVGTEHLVVKREGKTSYLTAFEPGSISISIPNIRFPKNYRVEVRGYRIGDCLHEPNFTLQLGGLTAGLENHHCTDYAAVINNARIEKVSVPRGVPFLLEIEQRDGIVRLVLDSKELQVARYANLATPSGLVLKFYETGSQPGHAYQLYGRLYSLRAIDLGT